MKKLIIILVFLLSSFLYAEKIKLKIITTDNKTINFEVDDYARILNISSKLMPENNSDEIIGIKKIEGTEKLPNIQIVRIDSISLIDDYSFLFNFPNLNEIYIFGTILTSLKFLENLSSISMIDINAFIFDEDLETIQNEAIDFSKLENLFSVNFSISMLTLYDGTKGFDSIPNFINVQNKPIINLGNNEITSVNDKDIEILSQFSEIHLWPNPILSDFYEMEKLQDLNIITK